jgi:hypothetical protein
VIPSGRPPIPFTSYNTSAQKNKTSKRNPAASSGDTHSFDPDIEIIKSDLPQPVQQHSIAEGANPQVSSAKLTTGQRLNNMEGGKKIMSASGGERQSQIMKGEWV